MMFVMSAVSVMLMMLIQQKKAIVVLAGASDCMTSIEHLLV